MKDKLQLTRTRYSEEKLLGIFALTVGLIGLLGSLLKGSGIGLLLGTIGIVCGAIVLTFSKQKLVHEEIIEVPIKRSRKRYVN